MHRVATTLKPVALGIAGAVSLLVIYFLILTLVSGWEFTLSQFVDFWYFIVGLAIGFGIQIGLYTYLRGAIHDQSASGKVVAVSGTTSTAAMISCCTHYLVNILPALGTAGLVTLVAQYQVELFWVGLIANAAGILYIGIRVVKFSAAHARTEPSAVAQA